MSNLQITQFLAKKPYGATGREIADHLERTGKSVGETLIRLVRDGAIKSDGKSRSRMSNVYRLPSEEQLVGPPCFRAMETLRAMQEAARAQLVARTYPEAA
jgi:hypothetical protein